MDVYDRAAELSVPSRVNFGPSVSRPLTADELNLLVEHLVDTEMSPLEAIHALQISLDLLTLDDLDTLAARIARCRHCNTWTRLAQLVNGVCPDCLDESRV